MSIFKDDILKGKTAYITGGGSGICKGIAEKFSAHGANVTITSRKQERLDEAAKEISGKTGGKVLPVAADVRDPEAVQKAIDATVEEFGGIDIVICGAAGNFPIPAAALTDNGFKTVVDIDLMGSWHTCKHAMKHLHEAGKKHGNASIIAITATLQYTGVPFQAHVSAAKAGIDAMIRTLANEWGGSGVRANGVAPGPIDNTEGMKRLAPTDKAREMAAKMIPLKRFGEIEEIADACLFLTSDAAKYITGATLIVDGGQWIGGLPLGM